MRKWASQNSLGSSGMRKKSIYIYGKNWSQQPRYESMERHLIGFNGKNPKFCNAARDVAVVR